MKKKLIWIAIIILAILFTILIILLLLKVHTFGGDIKPPPYPPTNPK
jgi:hypothetical protein